MCDEYLKIPIVDPSAELLLGGLLVALLAVSATDDAAPATMKKSSRSRSGSALPGRLRESQERGRTQRRGSGQAAATNGPAKLSRNHFGLHAFRLTPRQVGKMQTVSSASVAAPRVAAGTRPSRAAAAGMQLSARAAVAGTPLALVSRRAPQCVSSSAPVTEARMHGLAKYVQAVEKEQMKADLIPLKIGMTLKVGVTVIESGKSRVQPYQGLLIAMHKNGVNSTITVRKVFQGIGVERVFPIHSPLVTLEEVPTAGTPRVRLPLRGGQPPFDGIPCRIIVLACGVAVRPGLHLSLGATTCLATSPPGCCAGAGGPAARIAMAFFLALAGADTA